MSEKKERVYRVVNDTGELGPDIGAVFEMTCAEIVKATGVPSKRILRRLNHQHLRLFSRLKLDPATAQRIGRNILRGKMKGERAAKDQDAEKERARDERVRNGHRSL